MIGVSPAGLAVGSCVGSAFGAAGDWVAASAGRLAEAVSPAPGAAGQVSGRKRRRADVTAEAAIMAAVTAVTAVTAVLRTP